MPDTVPLPSVSRDTAPYFVNVRPFQLTFGKKTATVYVKQGNFFRSQGGLTDDWGKSWVGIAATSPNDARIKAHASVGTVCPGWHLANCSE